MPAATTAAALLQHAGTCGTAARRLGPCCAWLQIERLNADPAAYNAKLAWKHKPYAQLAPGYRWATGDQTPSIQLSVACSQHPVTTTHLVSPARCQRASSDACPARALCSQAAGGEQQ
jgi:hypothetical protein